MRQVQANDAVTLSDCVGQTDCDWQSDSLSDCVTVSLSVNEVDSLVRTTYSIHIMHVHSQIIAVQSDCLSVSRTHWFDDWMMIGRDRDCHLSLSLTDCHSVLSVWLRQTDWQTLKVINKLSQNNFSTRPTIIYRYRQRTKVGVSRSVSIIIIS